MYTKQYKAMAERDRKFPFKEDIINNDGTLPDIIETTYDDMPFKEWAIINIDGSWDTAPRTGSETYELEDLFINDRKGEEPLLWNEVSNIGNDGNVYRKYTASKFVKICTIKELKQKIEKVYNDEKKAWCSQGKTQKVENN